MEAEVSCWQMMCYAILVGAGATALLDLWAVFLQKKIGRPRPNWGMAGRWVLGWFSGMFFLDHSNLNKPSAFERGFGWCFHYGVGIAYAALLPLIYGASVLLVGPSWNALIGVGLVLPTIAGLCIMAPGMGNGFLASKAPVPAVAWGFTLLAHVVFTLGLWLFSWLARGVLL